MHLRHRNHLRHFEIPRCDWGLMDDIPEYLSRGPPHAMLFVDDLVICGEKTEYKQKSNWNYGERKLRIKASKSAVKQDRI